MKKLISTVFVALFAVCAMVGMTGCSKKPSVTIEYQKAESVELVSYDEGLENLEAQDNKVVFTVSKDGTYELQVRVDDEIVDVTITNEKGVVSVEDNSSYDSAVGVK